MTGDIVEVWLIRTDLPEWVLTDLLAVLDDGERERAGALMYPDSRRRFIAAHGAFRVVLGRRLGVPPASLRWQLGPHGKPELAGPGPRVSFSHSGDLAALATAPCRRVGVDIQQLLSGLDVTRMAARFYPRQEAELVASAPGPARQVARFTELWARKEACVKVAGGRLLPAGLEQVVPRTGIVGGTVGGTVGGRVIDSDGGTSGITCLVRGVRAPRGYRAAVAAEGTSPYGIIRRWARLLRDSNEIYRSMLICLADIRLVCAIAEGSCCHRRLMGRSTAMIVFHRLDKPLSRIYGRGSCSCRCHFMPLGWEAIYEMFQCVSVVWCVNFTPL
jgi:4'-phosphopantetheinyl transferase